MGPVLEPSAAHAAAPCVPPSVGPAVPASASVGAPAIPSAAVRGTRATVLGGALALIVLGLVWELWLAPTGRGTLALKVLPLAFALPGVWRYRLYTVRWLSLLLWAYVAEGLVRATSESGLGAILAGAEAALAVALFVACVLHVRARFAAGAAVTPA
ncbi:MAG: DUF2069 domain-containing protein [Rubrivivax sp.]